MVITAVIGFAVHQVVREWDEVSATLRHLAWPHLVLALVAVSAGVLLGPLVWRAALAVVSRVLFTVMELASAAAATLAARLSARRGTPA